MNHKLYSNYFINFLQFNGYHKLTSACIGSWYIPKGLSAKWERIDWVFSKGKHKECRDNLQKGDGLWTRTGL